MRRVSTPLSIGLLAAVVLIAVITWPTRATTVQAAEEHRVATVDILLLLQRLMQTDEYLPQREAVSEEWSNRIQGAQANLDKLEAEIRLLSPNDPRSMALRQQYQQSAQQLQQLSQQGQQAFQSMTAEQASSGYTRIRDRARQMATEWGYSHLIASRTEVDFSGVTNLPGVTQEILARPVLLSPPGDDITEAIAEAMNLPELEDDEPAESTEAGPAPEAPTETE